MSILITILLIIGGIIGLLLIIGLFSRKGYSLQRSITIDKPVAPVFDYLRHIKHQDKFSKWVMTDPGMKREFKGTDGTVGFIYAWDGNKQAGKGEQEIKALIEGKHIDLEVRFEKPFVAVAKTPFSLEAISANQTKVTWGMTSSMNYPMNIMLLIMNMEKMLGKDMDISLGNLKRILES